MQGSDMRSLQPRLHLPHILTALTLLFSGCGGTPHGDQRPGPPEPLAQVALPRAWLLSVGVSKYTDRAIDQLQYADADATAVGAFFSTEQGGAIPDTRRTLLVNEHATRPTMMGALEELANRAGETDTLIVFLAMHATVDDELYFLASDVNSDNLSGTAVSESDLTKSFRRTRASQVVLLLDVCHGGAFGKGDTRGLRAFETARRIERFPRSMTTVAVLSASAETERAKEDRLWDGHGVFTYYLLEGLRGSADRSPDGKRDGVVTLRELADFVAPRVERDREGKQHPKLVADREIPLSRAALPVCSPNSNWDGTACVPVPAVPPFIPPPDVPLGSLSPQDQVAETDVFLSRMAAARTLTRQRLNDARDRAATVAVVCLDDKLNQMDVAIRSARERSQSLEACAARNDVDLCNHEFTILTVLRQRVERLAVEANQC